MQVELKFIMVVLLAVIHPEVSYAASQLTSPVTKTKENTTAIEPTSIVTKVDAKKTTLLLNKSMKHVFEYKNKKQLNEQFFTRTKSKLMPKLNVKPRNKTSVLNLNIQNTTRPPIMKTKVFTIAQRRNNKFKPKIYKRQMTSFKILMAKYSGSDKNDNISYAKEVNDNINITKTINLEDKNDNVLERNKRDVVNINNLVRVPGFKNYWFIQVPKAKTSEELDAQEFIFIGPPQKNNIVRNKAVRKKPKKDKPIQVRVEDDVEIVTDMAPGSY